MANLKEIAAALAILTAGTLTLSGCKKEETVTPDEGDKAADTAAPEETPAEGGEASCSGDKAAEGGEASCSGEAAAEAGEASCSGEAAADGAAEG